jgi:glycosyltransferase involved in cell wall biosynthesis
VNGAVKRVSVITPCLNPGDRLVRCLDSVAAQTYGDVEHIIVDGGSTDGAVELARSRGLRVISEPDRGQTDAINKGFRLARGDLLSWLNADDLLVPGAIEAVVEVLREVPSAGWAYGDCEVQRNGVRELPIRPPHRIGRESLDCGSVLAQPGFFVTRWALDRVGELDDSLNLAMDFDLWLRLLDAEIDAVRVPTSLAVFELHDASKTGTIPSSEFFFEEGLALLKSRRTRQAGFAFGRAAAAATEKPINVSALNREVERVLRDPRIADIGLDRRAADAGARTEAAVIAVLAGSPGGLRLLMRRDVWGIPEARGRLRLAFRRSLPVLAERVRR